MPELVVAQCKKRSHCHDFELCCLDLFQYSFEVLQLHITAATNLYMGNMVLFTFNTGILCILK